MAFGPGRCYQGHASDGFEMRPHLIAALAIASLSLAAPASAQPDPESESAEPDIDDVVAAALLARGKVLFDSGDYQHAKQLFVESLERSASGPSATEALAMLRSTNEKLGSDRDAGRPGPDGSEGPLDPYGGTGDQAPLDPYGDAGADPGGEPEKPVAAVDSGDEPNTGVSRGLMAWGGGYGFLLGMAIGGPNDDAGDVQGGAVALGLLGLGAGIGGGYLISRKVPLSRGQVTAISSAGVWTGLNAAFIGDLVTDTGTGTNDIYTSLAIGGALGTGAGVLYARYADIDEGDVAFTNSLASYGLASGLLLGVAMSPPRSEAYSINGMLGSIGGVAAGLLWADRFDMSRGRTLRIDLGAGIGLAATWGLLYPLVRDESTNNDEQFAGAFSVLTMWGGAAVTYYLTRDRDGGDHSEAEVAERYPSPPALVRRAGSGRWSLGTPLVRPIQSPALAPPAGLAMGVDLASGRF